MAVDHDLAKNRKKWSKHPQRQVISEQHTPGHDSFLLKVFVIFQNCLISVVVEDKNIT